jgi:RND family efflux transporter MFP subunit
MKKSIVILVLLAGLGFAGYKYGPALRSKNASAANEEVPARPTEAVVGSREIKFSVNAAGEIGPAEQVSVKPEINGLIDLLLVDIGDSVKKGATLFTLDDKELQHQRSSSVTEIERTKLQLTQAERNFKRAEQLYNVHLISQEIYEQSKTDFELARNALQKTESELALIDEHLTKTKILAPFDCTILTRPVSVGQAVSGSGGFNSGTEVLTIADLNQMIINAHINQADITRLHVNQDVEVAVEAVAGLKVNGKIERIAPQATIKNNIKGFAVRVLLRDVDKRIRPGMTANVKIPVAVADNVLAVPLAAVFTEKNPDSGMPERFVYVKKGDVTERRPVTVGVSDFFFAEIQSGLASGDIVELEQPKDDHGKIAKVAGMNVGDSASASKSPSAAPAAKPRGATSTPVVTRGT